jgi:altronate dehydratase small subunit
MINEGIEQVVLCHSKDNVATAKAVLRTGTLLELPGGKKVEAREEIPFAHKIALRRISRGEAVIKYGERIGRATRAIAPGEWVHIHNVRGERGKGRKK